MAELERALEITGLKMNQLNRHMKQNFEAFTKNGMVVNRLTGELKSYGQVVNKATLNARRFKFEWLSLLFAGMALDRTFGGLIRSQLQLFGVSDLLSSAWTIVLLPIMELITPILFQMIDAFMNLPEPIKLVIGAGVLFGAILGKVLVIAGSVILAFSGLIAVFGTLSTSLIGIGILLGGFILGVGIFKKLKDVANGFGDNIDKVQVKLVNFGLPETTAQKITDLIKNIFDYIRKGIGWVIEKFSQNLPRIKEGIKNFMRESIDWIVTNFKNNVPKIVEGVREFVGRALKYIADNLPEFLEKGLEILTSIMNGILNNSGKIANVIQKIIQAISNFITSNLDRIINFGLKILNAILEGLLDNIDLIGYALSEMLAAFGKWVGEHAIEIGKLGLKIAAYLIKGLAEGLANLIARAPIINKILKLSGWEGETLRLPRFQSGGLVANTGPAILHAGERVIPKNRANNSEVMFSPTVNVTATINNDLDVRILAEKLNKYWANDIQRMIQGK